MRRRQGWKGSLPPPELANAEQWGWGQGADPWPCQLMEQHCCPPKACWATNTSGSLERNFEDSDLDKTVWFRGFFKSKHVAHVCLLYMQRIHLCLYVTAGLGHPQNGLLHPEIFWKTCTCFSVLSSGLGLCRSLCSSQSSLTVWVSAGIQPLPQAT